MNYYQALMELRKIYTSPLLDLALKIKLKQIIKTLEKEKLNEFGNVQKKE